MTLMPFPPLTPELAAANLEARRRQRNHQPHRTASRSLRRVVVTDARRRPLRRPR